MEIDKLIIQRKNFYYLLEFFYCIRKNYNLRNIEFIYRIKVGNGTILKVKIKLIKIDPNGYFLISTAKSFKKGE